MALIGDNCVFIGNVDWDIGDPVSVIPNAEVVPEVSRATRGSVFPIDGQQSYSLDLEDTLYYEWEVSAPDNSQENGRVFLDEEELFLTIDQVGAYTVTLVVRGANGGCSQPAISTLAGFVSAQPNHEQISLRTDWVWQLLPDFWSNLKPRDRKKLEVVWRGIAQTTSSALLDVYNADANKSILSVQSEVGKRWRKVKLSLPITTAELQMNFVWRSLISPTPDADGGATSKAQIATVYEPENITFPAKILSTSEIAPIGQITPQSFDVGKTLRVTVNGVNTFTRITNVNRISADQATYQVDAPVLVPELSSNPVSCSLQTDTPHQVVGVLSDLSGNDRQAIRIVSYERQDAQYVLSADNEKIALDDAAITVLPSLLVTDAYKLGVRPNDTIWCHISSRGTGRKVLVSLGVRGVTPSESEDIDHVLFSPLGGKTFTQLLQSIVNSLEPEAEFAQILFGSLVNDITSRLPQMYGSRILGSRGSAFSITVDGTLRIFDISPIKIKRKSVVRLEDSYTTLGTLTEFIERHDLDPAGQVILTESGDAFPLGRAPIHYLENQDFKLLQGKSSIFGLRASVNNPNRIESPITSPMRLLVSPGDTLDILSGFGIGSYTITRVGDNEFIVDPPVRFDFTDAEATVTNKAVVGLTTPPVYLRILSSFGAYTPDYLWAEHATVSNDALVEANLGSPVGLSYQAYQRLNTQVAYLSLVKAIHRGRVTGPSIKNISDVIASVAGIPFAESQVRVLRIDPEYEVDADGVATQTRILVEELDKRNNILFSTDRYKVYSLPALRPDRDAEYSGLARYGNREIAVGDVLPQGFVFGRGVRVLDQFNGGNQSVKARHRFKLTIDSDSTVLGLGNLPILERTLSEIKPNYTNFDFAIRKFVIDEEQIETRLALRLRKLVRDNPYILSGPADVFDDELARHINAPFHVLTTWYPSDGTVTRNGNVWQLSTNLGGLAIPPKGVVKSYMLQDEEYSYTQRTLYDPDVVWITEDDLVVFLHDSDPIPRSITSVISDNVLTFSGPAPTAREDLAFVIVRPISGLLFSGQTDYIGTTTNVPAIHIGGKHSGAGIGDHVSYDDYALPARYIIGHDATIGTIELGGVVENTPVFSISPIPQELRFTPEESSGVRNITIRRPSIETKATGTFFLNADFTLVSTDTLYADWQDQAGNTFIGVPLFLDFVRNPESLGIRAGHKINIKLADGSSLVSYVLTRIFGTNIIVVRGQNEAGQQTLLQQITAIGISSITATKEDGLEGAGALDAVEHGVNTEAYIHIRFTEEIIATGRSVKLENYDGAQPGDILLVRDTGYKSEGTDKIRIIARHDNVLVLADLLEDNAQYTVDGVVRQATISARR